MGNDRQIRLLPDQIINKIAAGEVVDRPASVVKELMENALDAGASSIEVAVVDGGVKLIAITDDGAGMDRDNALMAIERHATSKIRHVDDIERVETLGFRGEALAAIASVSRFTLTTRTADSLTGTTIRVHGGRMEEVAEAGCPPGTRMEVRQLFFNVPARRKFLRTAATELNHIRQVFLLYAMGRPDIALRLVVDEKEIYRLDGESQLEDRIRQLFGAGMMDDLRLVDWTDGQWGIRGLTSGPNLTRADRAEQYIFINGRPASAPVLGYAINEAYSALLPRGRYPVMMLFIDLPPEEVDVNVHPTKKEVRFRRSGQMRDALLTALRQATLTNQSKNFDEPNKEVLPAKVNGEFLAVPDLPSLPAFSYPRNPGVGVERGAEALQRFEAARSGAGENTDKADETDTDWQKSPWQWCRILGQIAGYFVVLETDEGMMLLDPQSAHERVLYERMMKAFATRTIKPQGLLTPETVSLPPAKAGYIRKHVKALGALGFGISEFGGETFIVDALPSLLGEVSAAAVLDDLATDLEDAGKSVNSESVLRQHIAQVATRVAVRTTKKLSREELEKLISDLAMTELPYTSPRGRPTIIFTSLQELKKKFGRV
jgi:DNA mismatch repair protein MutL